MRRLVLIASAVVVVVALAAPRARACAACSCGSTAALPAGAEIPFAGRARAGLHLALASTTTLDPLGDTTVRAAQLEAFGLVVLAPGVVVDGALPLGLRLRAHDAGLGDVDGFGLGSGDASLGVRLVWQDRAFRPRLLLGVRAGASLPTTSLIDDLSAELQPGAADLTPTLHLSAAWLASPSLSLVAIAGGGVPLWSRDVRGGTNGEGRVLALWRVHEHVSVTGGARAGGVVADGEEHARGSAGAEAGVVVDVGDVAISASASVPLAQLEPSAHEGGRADVSVSFDW